MWRWYYSKSQKDVSYRKKTYVSYNAHFSEVKRHSHKLQQIWNRSKICMSKIIYIQLDCKLKMKKIDPKNHNQIVGSKIHNAESRMQNSGKIPILEAEIKIIWKIRRTRKNFCFWSTGWRKKHSPGRPRKIFFAKFRYQNSIF